MKASDYIVNFLIEKGVTDVFGIPGGVVLDFLDSIGKRKDEITARLNYNEQASAFSACGYAQADRKLAVAYATRGPGITNMITGITDAFCESLPVFFITAHSHKSVLSDIRIEEDQEFNTVAMLSSVTKYAVMIENADDIRYEIEKAYYIAVNNRPGPVLIDFSVGVLRADINPELLCSFVPKEDVFNEQTSTEIFINNIKFELNNSKRPVILIGDGIRQSCTLEYIIKLSQKWKIPILSSRNAQDIIPNDDNYYGYIGSHGTRYANFILSKCDLIISLGNRLMFKPSSGTFGVVTARAKIIRIDIDKYEFLREIPNSLNFTADLKTIIPLLINTDIKWHDITGWLSVCTEIKETLFNCDTNYPVNIIANILRNLDSDTVITCDTGNNELWLSRAHCFASIPNRVLYPKSFGALGCSLPKAIGAYYSKKNKILCFTGDQGLQMNIQELQFIIRENLPITIIVLNNHTSGMIRDQQERQFASRFISTTMDSGYNIPNLEKIAFAYGIKYFHFDYNIKQDTIKNILFLFEPIIIELTIKSNISIIPYLPKGFPMQKFVPEIDNDIFNKLEYL